MVLLGLVHGSAYGLLAAGLVLVYRSSKIINFAHAAMGAFIALLFGVAVTAWRIPYWAGFLLAMAFAAGLGALAEAILAKRLGQTPALIRVVATLGFAELMVAMGVIVGSRINFADRYPHPPGFRPFSAGALTLSPSEVAMLVLAPIVVVSIAWFLRRTGMGLAIKAAAENSDRARLTGLSPLTMSAITWAIATCLSTLGAILQFPGRGFFGAASFGPTLMLRALVPAVLARMEKLPAAIAGGLVLGVVEQTLLREQGSGAAVEVTLFVLVLAVVSVSSAGSRSKAGSENWTVLESGSPLAESSRRVPAVRHLGKAASAVALALAVVIPLNAPNNAALVFTSIVSFALVGLSVGVVTGMSGQLTLGQFAFAGVGAAVAIKVVSGTESLPLGVLEGALAAAAASVLVGIPALRSPGLMLAVTTMAFSLAAAAWLFQQPWMLGSGVDVPEFDFFGIGLESPKMYYLASLAFLVPCLWLVRNIRTSGFGLSVVAVRDNEPAARAFSIPPNLRRSQAFAAGGFLAGLGGAVYAHSFSRVGSETFSAEASILVLAISVIGGLSTLAGPVVGALYIIGVPAFVPLDSAGIAATALGWLLLLLYFPGGLPQLLSPVRDRVISLAMRRNAAGSDPEDASAGPGLSSGNISAVLQRPEDPATSRTGAAEVVLRMDSISKAFGGVIALDSFSADLYRGEVVGLIGPNGAGKTSLLDVVSGSLTPDAGSVEFDGRNIDGLPPQVRARRGLVRSFQNGPLFPTLTVIEILRLSQERRKGASFLASCVGVGDKGKRLKAEELADLFGLGDYRHYQIGQLSTGTRRIVELACITGMHPSVILLDEPSASIAQAETATLGELLISLKLHLGATLLVVEHNMPLVGQISDRIWVMDTGRLIASGKPEDVSEDPQVRQSVFALKPLSEEGNVG